MAILILSDANHRFLKHILMNDFQYRSSHADQLIATLCGFQTHASIRAAVSCFDFSPVARIDFERFEERAESLGYCRDEANQLAFVFKNFEFPTKPWRIFLHSQRQERDDWFFNCELRSAPFLTIDQKRKYCTLQWDSITIIKNEDRLTVDHNDNFLVNEMYSEFCLVRNGSDPKAFFDAKSYTGEIRNLSLSSARQLANSFYYRLSPFKV